MGIYLYCRVLLWPAAGRASVRACAVCVRRPVPRRDATGDAGAAAAAAAAALEQRRAAAAVAALEQLYRGYADLKGVGAAALCDRTAGWSIQPDRVRSPLVPNRVHVDPVAPQHSLGRHAWLGRLTSQCQVTIRRP